ncbi:MAG TPA: DMT family transporter [Alphaproteobacteria bacterium]|nr:DMT family transporter [Alphaproteobacteria bacterium]
MASSSTSAARGIGLALLAFALLSSMDAVIKTLGSGYSVAQIAFSNGLFSLVPTAVLAAMTGGWATLRTRRPGLQALRGVFAVMSGMCAFAAIGVMPLADAYAIFFAAPLIATALSPLLGESVGPRRWAAVIVGFGGVMVMLRPGAGLLAGGALAAMGTAVFWAGTVLTMRRLAADETSAATSLYGNLVAMAVCAALMAGGALFGAPAGSPFGFAMPDAGDALLMVLSGLLGGCGIVCVALAVQAAPSAVVAPFQYTQMIWGVFYGAVLFGNLPDGWTLAGAAIVALSGLYILHRETRRGAEPVVAAAERAAA